MEVGTARLGSPESPINHGTDHGPGESCGIGLLFSSTSRGPGTPPHIFNKTFAPKGARVLCSSPHSHPSPLPKLPSFSTPQDDVTNTTCHLEAALKLPPLCSSLT